MNYESLRLEVDDGIALVTLDRPHVANAFNRRLMDELVAVADSVRDDDAVRVVVITGAGNRHFSAGADLREFGAGFAADTPVAFPPRDFVTEIERLPQPVIAAVNGNAAGGGCELALACDLRVMAQDAHIGLTEIRFGAIPAGGGTQRLPRLIGTGRAKDMLYRGLMIDGALALSWGLVNEIVPRVEVVSRAMTIARELAETPAYAVQALKYVVNQGLEVDLDSALRLERRTALVMGSPAERQAAVDRATRSSSTYRKVFS